MSLKETKDRKVITYNHEPTNTETINPLKARDDWPKVNKLQSAYSLSANIIIQLNILNHYSALFYFWFFHQMQYEAPVAECRSHDGVNG